MTSKNPHKSSLREDIKAKSLEGMGYFSAIWAGGRGIIFLGIGLALLWNSLYIEETLKAVVIFVGIGISLVSIGMISYGVNLFKEVKRMKAIVSPPVAERPTAGEE